MDNSEITYILKWSDQIDNKFLEDFLYIINVVFGGYTKQILERKFINNIYGPSLIAIAYLNDETIGADAMLRNDVFGHIAFETIDTCVSEKCRGKGVFSNITKREVAEINAKYPDAIIYGFPNGNSFPGYVKMGWNIQCRLYPAPFLFPFLFDKEFSTQIDVEYAKWLCKSNNKFFYVKFGKKYYLILQGQRHYQMIGRINPEAALLFEKKKHPGLIRYRSVKKRIFNNDGYQGSIITYRKIPFDIPYWKGDTFIN